MAGLSPIFARLLFVYAILVEPVLGARMYRGLRSALVRDGRALVRFYRMGIALE